MIPRCRWVHTFGMRFPIDIAYLDADCTVTAITTMPPNRLGMIHRSAVAVVESYAGQMNTWGIRTGDVLDVDLAKINEQP